MASYSKIIYHLVFSTKNRLPTLHRVPKPEFFKYTWGILKNIECHLYRINAVDDHVHLLFSLPPKLALSDLVKDIKLATHKWLKTNALEAGFDGWQDGYGAFTLSFSELEIIRDYIAGQDEHHREVTYLDELRELLAEYGLEPHGNDPDFM
jgi:REP element-mobilizing transposase RayT